MKSLILAAALALTALALAAGDRLYGAGSPNVPPIIITINPESRVSVALGGALPPPVSCGSAANLIVKIVNQGFVTAHLEAELVGIVAGVKLDFDPKPLTGAPEESQSLHVTLTQPGTTDITIAFKLRHETADLGGRGRIHFLLNCVRAS
jgi:hypothetical protein